jgi:hypothetical protein
MQRKDDIFPNLRLYMRRGEIVAAIITAVEKDGQVESVVGGAEECGYRLISGSLLGAQVVTNIVLGVD